MADEITPKEISRLLKNLDLEWSVIGNGSLERIYKFDNFRKGLDFIVKVGGLADKQNHHPDITLSWGKVIISLTTHEKNGLTKQDFELAAKIDEL